MKKIWIGVAIIAAVVLLIVSIPLANNAFAAHTLKRLTATPLPPSFETVQTVVQVGRFVGNGDGVQYFAAMLVKGEDEANLRACFEPLGYGVTRQISREITVLEHNAPVLETMLRPGESYYLVYVLQAGVPPFAWADVRGC